MVQKQTLAEGAAPGGEPRLLDQVRSAIRHRHYSYRPEQSHVHWIKRFIRFVFRADRCSAGSRAGSATKCRPAIISTC